MVGARVVRGATVVGTGAIVVGANVVRGGA